MQIDDLFGFFTGMSIYIYLGRHESIHNQDRQNLNPMTYHTFMLLQGEKVRLEVDPNAINTVAVSLEDGSIILPL